MKHMLILCFALIASACATVEKPAADPPRIIVSCGTLKGIGLLTVIEDGEKASMLIACGDDV